MCRQLSLVLSLLLVFGVFTGNVFAQKVELLYTKAAQKEAMALKKVLKVAYLNAFNALALRKAPEVRVNAYLKKIADRDVVLIVGETTLKAVSQVPFPMPVIVIDAADKLAAPSPIVRVLDTDFKTTVEWTTPPVPVTASDSFTLSPEALAKGIESIFKCERASKAELIAKLITEIIRLRKG